MAEEGEGGGGGLLWWVIGGMIILVALWFASGAYKTADVRGLFLYPPAPIGPGGSYGPQVGEPNPNYQTNEQTR